MGMGLCRLDSRVIAVAYKGEGHGSGAVTARAVTAPDLRRPASVSNLTSLRIFDLGQNNLSGYVPRTVGKLQVVQQVYLYNNMLEAIKLTTGRDGNLSLLYQTATSSGN